MRVILSYHWTSEDGVNHRPETTLTVPDDVGRDLILTGRARSVTDDQPEG